MGKRDSIIDNFRAMIMLYIVLVIHGIHNFHYMPTRSTLFSLMIIEMPIIFFISGVSCKLSRRKSIPQSIVSRFKRIILPYFIWAIFALLCILLTHSFTWKGLWLMLSCNNIVNIPYVTQMWFILPYFLVFVLGSILVKVYDYCQERKQTIPFFAISFFCIALVIAGLDYYRETLSVELLRNVLVYGLFFVLGFGYKIRNKWALILLLSGLIGWAVLIYSGSYPFATQDNKFPPNLCFIFWGLGIIGALSLIMNNCKIADNRILTIWNKYGLEIYLYQNFAYWIIGVFIFPHLSQIPILCQYSVTTLLAFILLTIAARPLNQLDTLIIDRICNIPSLFRTNTK